MRFPRFLTSLLSLLLAASIGLFSAPAWAQPDPPAQAGRLSALAGDVSLQTAEVDDWQQAVPNSPLGDGDRIFTGENGRAEIQVGRSFLRIGANTDVTLVRSEQDAIVIGVAQGSVHLRILDLWDGQGLQLNTPSGSASFDRPGELRLDVAPNTDAQSVFTLLAGRVQIVGASGFYQDLQQGQSLQLIGVNPVYPQWLDASAPDPLDNWSRQRDQQILHAVSYRYMSPEIAGGDELDANGIWLPGTDYGAVWFPNNVPSDWTPYHYGHWVHHEPWGWVWVEDEPWGYAPFHYGRWVKMAGRWGWVPGPANSHPVWSPALVAFAGSAHMGGGDVAVWFPLGPGEPFHPWYRCSPRYMDQVNITNIAPAPRVVVQKTYVNINITNVTYVNQTTAVTVVRHEDFAAGRSASKAAMRVDAQDAQRFQVMEHPQPPPPMMQPHVQPPMRPVPVSTARPMLMNAQGKQFTAARGAENHAQEPPMRNMAPPPHPPAGHNVIAPPPNAAPVRVPPANAPQKFAPAGNAPMNNAPAQQHGAPQMGAPTNHSVPANPPVNTPIPQQNAPQQHPQPQTQPAAQHANPPQPVAPKPAEIKPADNKPVPSIAPKPADAKKDAPKKDDKKKDDKHNEHER